MQRALWTAATGMHAQQLNVDTIANNLANVNTTGFKRGRAEFNDLFYQTLVAPGTAVSAIERNPTGIQLGMGARPAAVRKLHSTGELKNSENPLDLAIEGQGFFKVARNDGTIGFTRDGSFTPNAEGLLVNSAGLPLDPPIAIPNDAIAVTVGRDGTVSVRQPGQDVSTDVGQIELANFINPAGLVSIGSNLYLQTEASGDPQIGQAGSIGLGDVLQGFLELSNVSIVTELVDLIAAQRAYELNSRAIQASDQMMQQLNNLVR